LILIHTNEKARGLAYLQQASHLGYIKADLALGQLFSPLSTFAGFARKNPELAMKHLDIATKDPELAARAFHEIANLVYNGLGGEKNPRVAETLQRRARDLDPTIPDLVKEPEMSNDDGNQWMIGGLCIAAVSLFGVAIWRHLRRR
jgi:hypothetical protein